MPLSGKTAVVTGAGRGIGKAICLVFARKGADVAATDVDEAAASQTSEEVRALGRKSLALVLDVTSETSVKRAAQSVLAEFGSIDIWVNNAGIGSRAMLHEMLPEQWDRVLNVNLRGAFLGIQAAARIMMSRQSGRIINISSRAAKGGSYGHCSYASSKAGMLALTKSAARELGAYHITVNAVMPGFIATELTKGLGNNITRPDQMVLPRPGKPEDVAYAAAFLASDEAEWITGTAIEVTGGTGMFAG